MLTGYGMQTASHNPCVNVGDGRHDPQARAAASDPAISLTTGDLGGGNPVDYRALYFEAAGHRNSLLIEVKSLKSHIVLLDQERTQLRGTCAKAIETANVRQKELGQLTERHALALARLSRYERSVWGLLLRLRSRLVLAISGQGGSASPATEPVVVRADLPLETQ
jgi:hypothetical protein